MSRLEIRNDTSISREVIPFIENQLSNDGYALVHLNPSQNLERDLITVAVLVGQHFAEYVSYHLLVAEESQELLAAHTEGISYSEGIVNYFALGCITSAAIGGETRVIDGRMAASIIRERHPEMAKTMIEYSSLANAAENARYALVITDSEY